jgi:hypothetical protein
MDSRGAIPVDKRSMTEAPMSNDLAYCYTLFADGFRFYIHLQLGIRWNHYFWNAGTVCSFTGTAIQIKAVPEAR